jgi:phospholipase C
MGGNLDKLDHLVVLMLENRSLDSLLGYLYARDRPAYFIGDFGAEPGFDGVAGKDLGNPGPDGREVPVREAPFAPRDMCNPCPDPGETFSPHVNTQLFGEGAPSPEAPMNGFVLDYLRALRAQLPGDAPFTEAQYRVIMDCFTPEAVPVLAGLARAYAVSDRWFASVPSQTFCNRSFLHSGQSHGFVTNSDYVKWRDNGAPTVFDQLTKKGVPWRVYYDESNVASLTWALHSTLRDRVLDDNFRRFSSFREDCEQDRLAAYTFIEPRLISDHNDMHPPSAYDPLVASSILAGEVLVNDIYEAVRANPEVWRKTLLVITFDEHGGCYDHVSPPAATPPVSPPLYPLESGFGFDRFGVRVPAIFISPYIEAGTVVRSGGSVPFDHTTVIRTLAEKHGLAPLGGRDAAAPSLAPLLTRATPRTDSVSFTPRPYTPTPPPHAASLVMTLFHQEVCGLLSSALGAEVPDTVREVGHAISHLEAALKARLAR